MKGVNLIPRHKPRGKEKGLKEGGGNFTPKEVA
jgi:hypothetical protein